MAHVELNEISKAFGPTKVLHDVRAQIEVGEFLVIVGPSGCGKSTLLRILAGLEKADAGEVVIGDRVVNKLTPRERGTAMVFQNYALYPHMSVRQNLGYALKVEGLPREEIDSRIAETAAMLELEALLDRRPAQLSGGQRQRVAMGRAIARRPALFLFDEPLSNLDAKLRVQMRLEIRKLHDRLGATSVFVTHDQVEAMTMADKLIVMNNGRIEQMGAPREVYRHPRTTFVAQFLGSPPMNVVHARAGRNGSTLALAPGFELPPPSGLAGEVLVGIRPEHLEQCHISTPGAVTGEVEFVEDYGSQRAVHVRVGELGLTLMASSDAPLTDKVTFQAKQDRLHYFDQSTGVALAAVKEPAE